MTIGWSYIETFDNINVYKDPSKTVKTQALCGPGQKYEKTTNKCMSCPDGQYQDAIDHRLKDCKEHPSRDLIQCPDGKFLTKKKYGEQKNIIKDSSLTNSICESHSSKDDIVCRNGFYLDDFKYETQIQAIKDKAIDEDSGVCNQHKNLSSINCNEHTEFRNEEKYNREKNIKDRAIIDKNVCEKVPFFPLNVKNKNGDNYEIIRNHEVAIYNPWALKKKYLSLTVLFGSVSFKNVDNVTYIPITWDGKSIQIKKSVLNYWTGKYTNKYAYVDGFLFKFGDKPSSITIREFRGKLYLGNTWYELIVNKNCKGIWEDGTCSKTCGGGNKTQKFKVTKEKIADGNCPDFGKTRNIQCNTQPCPVDCEVKWGDWGSCSTTCGNGTQIRNYSIITPPKYGGNQCPTQTKRCSDLSGCKIDCVGYHDPWWSGCSARCGGGTKKKSFNVSVSPKNGGNACPGSKTASCNTHPCPVPCSGSWGSWSGWSKCSARGCNSSGTRTRTRSYTVHRPAQHGGSCPHSNGAIDTQSERCYRRCH